MPESEILKDKLILAVDYEEDVSETIREELSTTRSQTAHCYYF